jgi:uncharacterized membrane protein
MILFWAAIAVGIYFLVKQLARPAGDNDAKPRPDVGALGLLKARYARGEIGRDEYHRMREEIRNV